MAELQVLNEEKQRLKSLKDMLHRYSAPAAETLSLVLCVGRSSPPRLLEVRSDRKFCTGWKIRN